MPNHYTLRLAVAALMAGVPLASEAASKFDNARIASLNVAIGCQIQNLKEILITNTTGATIPAGTRITYDVVRYRSTEHYGKTIWGSALLPGASIRVGVEQSSSCTAWFRRLPLLAPN